MSSHNGRKFAPPFSENSGTKKVDEKEYFWYDESAR